jgi:hypothetical protein
MYDNYNYPAGADGPDAPWNEPSVPEKEFEVTCCQTLSRTAIVVTDNYIPGASGCDYESDDEGGCVAVGWQEDDDTSDTNWSKEYEENNLHTPLQLIQMLKGYVEKEAEQYLKDHKDDHLSGKVLPAEKHWQYRALLDLIEECDGWQDDETEFIEES